MARLLYPRDSAPLIKSAVRCHLRLCRKNSGSDTYISALTPSFNQFKAKHDALLLAGEAQEVACDDIMLADKLFLRLGARVKDESTVESTVQATETIQ